MNAAVEEKPEGHPGRDLYKFWKNELQLGEKRFKDWWNEADSIYDIYEAEKQQQNSYNVLWSNTEVLRPALYNSIPKPDVRRRFRDEDPVGKTVSKVLQRALDYTIDDYNEEDFDGEMKAVVLDCLITGRGKARVRYIPVFVPMGPDADPSFPAPSPAGTATQAPPLLRSPEAAPDAKDLYVAASGTAVRGRDAKVMGVEATEIPGRGRDAAILKREAMQEPDAGAPLPEEPQMPEQVADESAECDYVNYRDYMHSAGKKWKDVWWEAYRHRLDRDEMIKMFGQDVGSRVPLDNIDKDNNKGGKSEDELDEQHKTAEVWEIWDKHKREALFICKQFEDGPCLVESDPLQLSGFFPGPKPLYAIETTRSLLPIPPYRLYKQQAAELNRISTRINKITDAMKVRGAYAAQAAEEIANVLSAGDNEMIPITNPTALAAGLDKSIWMMPIETLGQVLRELYAAREQIKMVIAELTGISDIVRGSTDPNETKGAQVLKSQWGTLRLQRLQREVQRFARDLIRLLAEIISSRFSPEKLAAMTQVQLPTSEEKMMAQQSIQQAQMAPPQVDPMSGQPMPPAGPDPQAVAIMEQPTWDDVMQVMQSDELRGYKVDVETDSTVAETIDRDMQGLSEVLNALAMLFRDAMPAVQQGILPLEAVKEIALTVCRRSRMGMAVEDQIQAIGSQQQAGMMQQAQQPVQDGIGQIAQMIQDLAKKGDDMGNGMQNGLQEISNQIQVALENVGRQQGMRAVA